MNKEEKYKTIEKKILSTQKKLDGMKQILEDLKQSLIRIELEEESREIEIQEIKQG